MKIKVRNMVSAKGNTVVNQFIIETEEGEYFQSYNSIIAFLPKSGNVLLDETYWDYSRTTGKYRNLFLEETKAETLKKIEDGTYELVDLN